MFVRQKEAPEQPSVYFSVFLIFHGGASSLENLAALGEHSLNMTPHSPRTRAEESGKGNPCHAPADSWLLSSLANWRRPTIPRFNLNN